MLKPRTGCGVYICMFANVREQASESMVMNVHKTAFTYGTIKILLSQTIFLRTRNNNPLWFEGVCGLMELLLEKKWLTTVCGTNPCFFSKSDPSPSLPPWCFVTRCLSKAQLLQKKIFILSLKRKILPNHQTYNTMECCYQMIIYRMCLFIFHSAKNSCWVTIVGMWESHSSNTPCVGNCYGGPLILVFTENEAVVLHHYNHLKIKILKNYCIFITLE